MSPSQTPSEYIQTNFADRAQKPQTINDLPTEQYLVYILIADGETIVVGHGKENRARVIFDDERTITAHHLKAMKIYLSRLYGNYSNYERWIIPCCDKQEASALESTIHRAIGGNSNVIPEKMKALLLEGIEKTSPASMALQMAMCSAYSGFRDLRKWRQLGILNDPTWEQISSRLCLDKISPAFIKEP